MLNVTRSLGTGLSWLFAAAALAQPAGFANRGTRPEHQAMDRAQLERRLASVGYLLEKSSAARQIEAAGDAEALARRNGARERYRQAQEAFAAGDLAATAKLLAEAGALIMEGARLAAPAQVLGDKERVDFEARRANVNALLAAERRVSAEKSAAPESGQAIAAIEGMIAEASALAAAGQLGAGRALLDRAYLAARTGLSAMRGGQTLTRSVHFASKQEEYQYELDRNDTHRKLIQSLLAEARGAEAAKGAVQDSLEGAARLRAEAERAAATGDFAAGIARAEASTGELLRAIRGLGISVPGQGAAQ